MPGSYTQGRSTSSRWEFRLVRSLGLEAIYSEEEQGNVYQVTPSGKQKPGTTINLVYYGPVAEEG